MQLEIFDNNVTEVSVTKTSADFLDSGNASKEVSIFSLPANCSVLGVSVDIDENFIGVDSNEYLVGMSYDFMTKKNVTNVKSQNYNIRDFINDPFVAIPTAWSIGGNLNISVIANAGFGSQEAGTSSGGVDGNGDVTAATEEYNGSSWSASGNLNTARYGIVGTGTQTAGLSFSGRSSGTTYHNNTEEYNGTSWSAGGNLNTARRYGSGCGIQTAALAIGGVTAVENPTASNEEYDGATWTTSNDLLSGRSSQGSCGTQTAGLTTGGHSIDYLNTTEEYDGTDWSFGGNLNITSDSLVCAGTQISALSMGGKSTPSTTNSYNELYNGSVWSMGNKINVDRYSLGGCGTQSTGLSFGGRNVSGNYFRTTEEYTTAGFDSSILPISATVESQGIAGWSSGPNYPIVLAYASSLGESNSACMTVGGENLSTYYSNCYEHDGVTWNAGGSVSLGVRSFATAGTVLAGLKFGGTQGTPQAVTEEYNGTSWSAGGSLSQARQNLGGCGTQTTGLCIGGYYATSATYLDSTEEYNGATWSAGGDLAYGINSLHVAGTQTAAIESGGYNPTLGLTTFSSEYDGSVWTIASEMISAITSGASFGSQTSSVIFGGTALSGVTSNTFIYDGINWSTSKDTITPTKLLAGTGNSGGTNGIKICGRYSDNTYTPSVEYFDMHSSDNLDLTGGSLTFNIAYINYNNS